MLSLEDRLAIEQLYARYNLATDLDDTESLIQCYAPDGTFKGMLDEVRGHEAMREQAVQRIQRKQAGGLANVQHWNGSLVLEGDSEGRQAAGLCYFLFFTKKSDTDEVALQIMGTYIDKLAKVDGRWLFTSRRITFEKPTAEVIPKPQ